MNHSEILVMHYPIQSGGMIRDHANQKLVHFMYRGWNGQEQSSWAKRAGVQHELLADDVQPPTEARGDPECPHWPIPKIQRALGLRTPVNANGRPARNPWPGEQAHQSPRRKPFHPRERSAYHLQVQLRAVEPAQDSAESSQVEELPGGSLGSNKGQRIGRVRAPKIHGGKTQENIGCRGKVDAEIVEWNERFKEEAGG